MGGGVGGWLDVRIDKKHREHVNLDAMYSHWPYGMLLCMNTTTSPKLLIAACTIRRPDSSIYVDAKIRAAKETGMKTALVDISTEDISPAALETKVRCMWTYVCLPYDVLLTRYTRAVAVSRSYRPSAIGGGATRIPSICTHRAISTICL